MWKTSESENEYIGYEWKKKRCTYKALKILKVTLKKNFIKIKF